MSNDKYELYSSNSKKSKLKETERIVTPIVDSDSVKVKKRGVLNRLTKGIFAGDAGSIMEYLLDSVIIPKIQDIFMDTVTRGTEYMVYGDTKASRIHNERRSSIYYGGVANQRTGQSNRVNNSEPRRNSYDDYSDLIFRDRQKAEEILSRMYEDLQDYECCTVLSLKSMMGFNTTHTDEKYGWTDLSGSRIKKVRGGWLLELPTAIFLD